MSLIITNAIVNYSQKNDIAGQLIQEINYAVTDIHLEKLLENVEFIEQITEVKNIYTGIELISIGSDPFFYSTEIHETKEHQSH